MMNLNCGFHQLVELQIYKETFMKKKPIIPIILFVAILLPTTLSACGVNPEGGSSEIGQFFNWFWNLIVELSSGMLNSL